MKHIPLPIPGQPIAVITPALRALIDNVNQLTQIRGSNGIKVDTSHGGVLISYVGPNAPITAGTSTSSPESSGEVVLEMHPVWVASRNYRLYDRVLSVPATGGIDGYYSVFQCLDSSAGSGDIPGSSAKWQCMTQTATPWASGSTYSTGATAMHGTPGQYKIYTASAATSAGEEPGVSEKWVYAADVMLGIHAYPLPLPGGGTAKVPWREYILSDVRWELPYLKYCYTSHTFDKNGKLIASNIDSDYVTVATGRGCS